MPLFLVRICVFALVFLTASRAVAEPKNPKFVRNFLKSHCYDCHQGDDAESDLDLEELELDLDGAARFSRWERVFDRVQAGEMPPPDFAEVDEQESKQFLKLIGDWLHEHQKREWDEFGRVRGKRLTNLQLERTLHDLLGIDTPLASEMPDEARTGGFTTVADGQAMSHFQLETHLSVVDKALDEAFRRALSPPDRLHKEMSAQDVARQNPKRRNREPEMIDDRAVIWSSRLIFYGRLPATRAPEDGWYRFKIKASSLKRPEEHGVWCTVRTGLCVSSAPLLGWAGAFEANEEPREWTFEAWLPKGHMLEVRPGDRTQKMARFQGGQVGVGEGEPQDVPGVGFHSVVMERFHRGPDDDGVRRLLFEDLEVRGIGEKGDAELVSDSPGKDAARLIQQFASRAFRRPVSAAEVAGYVEMVQEDLDNGVPMLDALRGGYRALLCSPRFLYFHEEPGPLDAHAVASRLSYLLWNRMPDEELLSLAESGELLNQQVLREQVDRMLEDPRGTNFIPDFAAEWLDLSEIDFTEPDEKLYPGFDVIVQQSMLEETHAFLNKLLEEDLSVTNLIRSDFTYLNSRLARHYGIDGVDGDALRRVELDGKHRRHRGGVLTQGALLKVTANGTTTSPVIRGVWVSERLLGEHIPPPPENVPAIEPDIRGANTIREQLAKHRSQDSCASCHVKIDPPGFALEHFDPAGKWREHYTRLDKGRRAKGSPVDASYELPDGTRFDDLDGFRDLVLSNPSTLARNLAEKILTYGTGAPVGFTDRPVLDEIVQQAADSDFGFRSLLHAAVTSPVFLEK
jgi:hypothetical protein